MEKQWQQYIKIIKQVVKPALGCTEPIAAAFACAVAAKELKQIPEYIDVYVSDNLYKNSKGVFVPGTGKIGLAIAAATGAIGGDPDADLQVLSNITSDTVLQAQSLIDLGKVNIHRVDSTEFIYCSVVAKYKNDCCVITISGHHTHIIYKSLNDHILYKEEPSQNNLSLPICQNVDISIKQIYDFATQIDFSDISFILDAATLNKKLAKEGLEQKYGLQVGRTFKDNIDKGLLSSDLMNKIQMFTSAASDARMGGAVYPAMSNFGSGNQGIAATIPVTVAAEYFQASNEKLARALIMSHLGAIYIKSYYPPLSAFCGNTVTSAAVAMALVYLAKGTFEQSCYAIQNVLSDSSGMVCDGAKSSCAMKICTSSGSAVRSFMMALSDRSVSNQGIIAQEVENSIKNIGIMISKGMVQTDLTIIELMSA